MDQQKMDMIAEDRRAVQERLVAKDQRIAEGHFTTEEILAEEILAQRNASRMMGLWMLLGSAAVNIALMIVCMVYFSGDGATLEGSDELFIIQMMESLVEFGVGIILLVIVACIGGAAIVFGIVGAVLSLINGTNQHSDIVLPLVGLGLHLIPFFVLFLF